MTSTPASSLTTFLLPVTIILLTNFQATNSIRYTTDLKIRYYSNGHLTCDHPMLNITQRSDVDSLYWIFQDGTLVEPSMYLNPKRYILEGLPDGVKPSSEPPTRYNGYNLTVLEVDDDVFGYYTCVVLFTHNTPDSPRLAAIRYGLNVDGADFSDLIEDYKENAIVGGIAAGAVLVLIGVVCFIWYNWCNEDEAEIREDSTQDFALQEIGIEAKAEVLKDNGMEGKMTYDNEAFKGDKSQIESCNDHGDGDKKDGEVSDSKSRL